MIAKNTEVLSQSDGTPVFFTSDGPFGYPGFEATIQYS